MFGIKRLKAHIAYLKQNRVADREVIEVLENRLINVLAKLNEPNATIGIVHSPFMDTRSHKFHHNIDSVSKEETIAALNKALNINPYANTSTYDLQIKLKYCVDCEDYETAKEIQNELNNRLIS